MHRKSGKAKPGSLRKPERMAAAESRSSDALALGWIRAGLGSGCACAERNPARLAAPFPLRNQEQIQGPKNAPIARFDGLGCYQTRSGINAVSGRGRRQKNSSRPRAEQALKMRLCGRCAASRARQSPVHCANQSGWRSVENRSSAGLAPGWVRAERNSACLAASILRNQEQIQGPENAPIARFDGLGCYQTRSEIGGFGALVFRRCPAGARRLAPCGRLRRDGRR